MCFLVLENGPEVLHRYGFYPFCSVNNLMCTRLRGCGLQARVGAIYNLRVYHLRVGWHCDWCLGFLVGCFVCLF